MVNVARTSRVVLRGLDLVVSLYQWCVVLRRHCRLGPVWRWPSRYGAVYFSWFPIDAEPRVEATVTA
jgi:hypothetical protein